MKAKYSKALPGMMYSFFRSYDGIGAPSFIKFAQSIGVSLETLASFRRWERFDAAWRECSEIRRDYLTDGALMKKFDSSFTKFILTEDKEILSIPEGEEIRVSLEVIE